MGKKFGDGSLDKEDAAVSKGIENNTDFANYFLSIGTNLKGQNQSSYKSIGVGLSVEASFDPLKLHTAGALSSEITLGVKAGVADKSLTVVQVGPTKIGDYFVKAPLILNFCSGTEYSGSAKLSLFAGVSYNVGVKGVGPQGSISAGGHASGAIAGKYYYALNLLPLEINNNERSDLIKTLNSLQSARNYKAFLKSPAVDFINKNSKKAAVMLKKTSVFGYLRGGSNIETSELVSLLTELEENSLLDPKTKAKASFFKKTLLEFKENIRPPVVTSIRMFCGEVRAMAVLEGEVDFTANVAGHFNVSVTSAIKLFDTEAAYRPVYVRYQSVYPAKKWNREDCSIVLTQDTRLLYTSFKHTPVAANAEIKFHDKTILGRDYISPEICSDNRMTYVTTSTYWSWAPDKNAVVNQTTLQGSGISFGCSFRLEDLKKCFDWSRDAKIVYVEDERVSFYTIRESYYRDSLLSRQGFTEYEVFDPVEIVQSFDMSLIFSDCIDEALDSYIDNLNFYSSMSMTIGLQSITGTIEKPHKTYVKLKGLIEEKYHDIKGAIEWLLFDAPDKGNPEYGRKFEKRLTERGKKHALGKSNPSKDILIVSLLEGYERALKKVEEEQEEIKKAGPQYDLVSRIQRDPATIYEKVQKKEYREKRVEKPKSVVAIDENYISVEERKKYILEPQTGDLEIFLLPKRQYLQMVAKKLKVTLEEIYDFFNDNNFIIELIQHYEDYDITKDLDSIILESGFLQEDKHIKVKVTPEDSRVKTSSLFKASNPQQLADIDMASVNNILLEFENLQQDKRVLNVIRMRKRIKDSTSKEKKVFKCGIPKVLGNSASAEVTKVVEAGSEGILDIVTKWYGSNSSSMDGINAYNEGVPAVALFSQ